MLNGFGATKLILVGPLHIKPPFQSPEPPRLFCSKEKVKGRLLQTEIKKKKFSEREKRGLEAFSYHFRFFNCVIFGKGGCLKSQLVVDFFPPLVFVLKSAI